MPTDPRAALTALITALERHLEAAAGRRGENDPVVLSAYRAVADAFDAMTSPRPYRPALTAEQALGELERCAGTQFDPKLAAGFVDAWRVRVQGGGLPARAVAR